MNSEIPSATTQQAALKQLRETNRSLELPTLALEDLIAMIEADLTSSETGTTHTREIDLTCNIKLG